MSPRISKKVLVPAGALVVALAAFPALASTGGDQGGQSSHTAAAGAAGDASDTDHGPIIERDDHGPIIEHDDDGPVNQPSPKPQPDPQPKPDPKPRPNDGAKEVKLNAWAQQKSNWCWAATGSAIANYLGADVSQNQFCNLAFGRSRNSSCPNDQATLENDQQAYDALGINPGRYVSSTISLRNLQTEIDNDRAIMTRIGWSAGGGHMMAITGYRASDQTIQWFDPWPSNQRINVADYSYYRSNWNFRWTHTLYGIGA